MKKIFLLCIGVLFFSISFSQFVYKIKADSVLITNDSCLAELNLENSTKNVKGFLYNKGNGRTEFRKALIKSYNGTDSVFIIGADTLNLSKSGLFWKLIGNSGTNPSTNFLGTTDAQRLVFRTKNTERMTIDTVGNVGIGTTTPTYKLEVNGNLKNNGEAMFGNGSTFGWVMTGINNFDQFSSYRASGAMLTAINGPLYISGKAGDDIRVRRYIKINSDNNGLDGLILQPNSVNTAAVDGTRELTIGANQVNAMKIFQTGNIVVQTGGTYTDAGYKLDVTGDARITSLPFLAGRDTVLTYDPVTKQLKTTSLITAGASVWGLTGNAGINTSTNFLGTTDGQRLVFRTKNIERVTIDTAGKTGIGTASPTTKLHVAGTGLFTDTLTATTMVTTDSSNRVATTAWVKQQSPAIDSTLKKQGGVLGVKVDTVLSYFTRNYKSNYADLHEEFWNGSDELSYDYSGTNSNITITPTTEANHPGLVQLTTGTQANGRAAILSWSWPVYMGSGKYYYETQVNIAALSTSGQRFQLACGLYASQTAVTQSSGIFFLYDEGGVSTGSTAASYWQTCTGNGGTRTYNTSLTQTTVATGWVKLRIYADYVSSQVSFYINGTLVSTHTANLPSATDMNLGIALWKSAGTTARTVKADYISFQRHFATSR